MQTTRIGDLAIEGVEPGALYLLRGGFGETETLHVISKYAGGEIRGYHRQEGDSAWALRYPSYVLEWTEVDQAAANLTKQEVNKHRPVASAAQLNLSV